MSKDFIIGYTYVVADLIHIGHVKYLQACKELCDKLVVGVLSDGATLEKKPKAIISYHERAFMVGSLKCVDVAMLQETYSPLPNVVKLQPDILFESVSHKKSDITAAKKLMSKDGGRVVILPYYDGQSSSKIKNRVLTEWKYVPEENNINDVLKGIVDE